MQMDTVLLLFAFNLASVAAVPEYIEVNRRVRLRDTHSESTGRLEILHAGEWGTICSQGWDLVDAYVACRQLGFPGVFNSYTAPSGSGRIWLAGVGCNGTESELDVCRHVPWGKSECSHHQDVGVTCRSEQSLSYADEECGPYPETSSFAVRLIGSLPHKGKVEVRVHGSWRPICADGWGSKDAKVVCGQLGYSGGHSRMHRKNALQTMGVSTNFSCRGSEPFIQTCKHAGFGSYRCIKSAYAAVKCTLSSHKKKDGLVRIRGSPYPWQGRVEVNHNGTWVKVCDREWDLQDATVVCRELGYGSAYDAVYRARDYFGQGFTPIVFSEVACNGNEKSLLECLYKDPADCGHIENAGVRCHIPITTPQQEVRLVDGTEVYGRVEIKDLQSQQWGTVCADDSWDISTGMVICRQLGLGFAREVLQSSQYVYKDNESQLMKLSCKGWELSLDDCTVGQWEPATKLACKNGVAFLTCTCSLPDLIPNFMTILTSLDGRVHSPLQLVKLNRLTCAFEENCLASTASKYFEPGDKYVQTRRELTRTLLRFSVNVLNFGTADFTPYVPRSDWEWHSCHNHFHSYENFAQYDIVDRNGKEVAEGHKASFCLEDVNCANGGVKRYSCEQHRQGISVNCYDSYAYDIDCQWIDITDVPHGNYTLTVSVNPGQRRAEMDFSNNKVICDFEYRADRIFFVTGKLVNVKCRLSG